MGSVVFSKMKIESDSARVEVAEDTIENNQDEAKNSRQDEVNIQLNQMEDEHHQEQDHQDTKNIISVKQLGDEFIIKNTQNDDSVQNSYISDLQDGAVCEKNNQENIVKTKHHDYVNCTQEVQNTTVEPGHSFSINTQPDQKEEYNDQENITVPRKDQEAIVNIQQNVVAKNLLVSYIKDICTLAFCNECKQIMNKRIYMCCDCHVCQDCVDKRQTCPICNVKRTVRNEEIENIIHTINQCQNKSKIECIYKNEGCNMKSDLEDIKDHEKTCLHLLINCIIKPCLWRGRFFFDLTHHLRDEHERLLIPNGTCFDNLNKFQICIAFEEVFLLMRIYKKGIIRFGVFHITSNQSAIFRYVIAFTRKDLENIVLKPIYEGYCMPCTTQDVSDPELLYNCTSTKVHNIQKNHYSMMYLMILDNDFY